MNRILRAIGCFEENSIEKAADSLYRSGRYRDENVTCRLFAFGNSEGILPILGVRQILFSHVIKFIYDRFKKYSQQKTFVGNWTDDGKNLMDLVKNSCNFADCERKVRCLFGLRSGDRV
jgi:hypothetical protein